MADRTYVDLKQPSFVYSKGEEKIPTMTIQLDLSPNVERGLLLQARQHGISLQDYLQQIVTREAQLLLSASTTKLVANLVELSESVRGLLTDEEVDTLFRHYPFIGCPLDLAKG